MTRCVCLYQNGERVRPSNGYPVRLLLPGFEGNMNVKWLRRLKLTAAPVMTKDETSKYTDTAQGRESLAVRVPDGSEVDDHAAVAGRSLLKGPGFYEISGLAWSGNGTHPTGRGLGRRRQELGAGGAVGPGAAESARALPRRLAMERRTGGAAKPRHRRYRHGAADARAIRRPSAASRGDYHYNAIASWAINDKGEATNVYA